VPRPYNLGVDARRVLRVAAAFTELAEAICQVVGGPSVSADPVPQQRRYESLRARISPGEPGLGSKIKPNLFRWTSCRARASMPAASS